MFLRLLTDRDIKKYYWKTHEIEFTEEFLQKHKISFGDKDEFIKDGKGNIYYLYGGCKLLGTGDFDAFVVVVDGEKIYSGGFPLAAFRSQCPSEIGISDSPGTHRNVRKSQTGVACNMQNRLLKID